MDAVMGLRERKKAATRQALHEAALRLAVAHGLEHLTVEAIADAAEVSRRTFSNYFASKEEALLHGDLVRVRRLLELLRERPAGENPWAALSAAATIASAERDDLDPLWLAQRSLMRGHPGLVAHQVASYGTVERDLAAELSTRLPAGSELPARVLAAAFLGVMRAATLHWIDHPERPLAETVRDALGYLAER
jgi:AcrR family transcriptional regulator